MGCASLSVKPATAFRYNAQHQLMRIEHYRNGQRQKRIDFRYDAFSRRIDKTHYSLSEDTGQTKDQRSHSEAYLWKGDTLIQVRQLDRLSFLKSHRIYLYEPGSHRPVALWDDALGLHHLDTDHAGTPKAMYSDETGEEVWRTDHDTYGQTTDSTAQLTHPVTGHVYEPHLRFQGQYEDIETGLYQNRYRYYDPKAGRYISQDPIGLMGGLNAYRYCPNPVEWVDPLGLCKEDCDGTNYLYRGVHSEHSALEDAKQGIVRPANPTSNISPELHNQGGYSSASPYTSWTRDPEIAKSFASSHGEGGVLLRVPQGKPGPNDPWSCEFSIDEYFEMEVLLKGPRYGAEVLKP